MRDVIAFAAQRGALLHPEALRWLQSQAQPLDALQRCLGHDDAPLLVTLDHLRGQLGAAATRAPAALAGSPARGPLGAALAAAVTMVPAALAAQPPVAVLPRVPPGPAGPQPLPPRPAAPARAPPRPAAALAAQVHSPLAERAHGLPGPPEATHQLAVAGAGTLAPTIEVLKDITGRSTCTGELSDFTRYFNDRLRTTRRLLRGRRELVGHIPIDRIPNSAGTVKLVGLVNEVRTTKNGYRIIELEDETGVVPILVPRGEHRNIELGQDAERLMQDEVIGVLAKVTPGKDILFLEGLFHPDVPLDFAPHRAPEPALACFISDVHVGAKNFLQGYWDNFVGWLQGPEGKRVKFLVVAGDVVDGIGVYPGQEHELAIPDIEGQYEFLARQFARVPDHVRVVLLPGNHDAVRPAEPQPSIAEQYRKGFKDNVSFVGNPSQVSLMGVEVLAYHGVSLIDYIQQLRGLDVHKPIKIMEEVLKRRHIAPMYGGSTPFAPEGRDYLVIERVPDVFVTGHLHTSEMGTYRNVTLINAGTWQDQTPYQKTLGIVPEPARVATIDLSTGKGGILRFDTPAS